MNPNRKPIYVLIISTALLLIGCIPRFDPDAMQTRVQVNAPPVYGTHTVGQTFVSQRPRLCAIEVAWDPTTAPQGPVVLSLRSSPESSQALIQIEVEPKSQRNRAMIRWQFTPLPGSVDPRSAIGQRYYFEISAPQATANHPLRLYAMPHDVYKPGNAYADGLPRAGDLTFHTFYDYNIPLLLQDIFKGLSYLWLILPTIALFIAPGYLLLQLWPSARRTVDIWSYVGLAFGLSLAVTPWILLWITQFGGALSPWTTHVIYWGCGIAMLIHLALTIDRDPHQAARNPIQPDGILLILILSVGLIVRFLAIRDLAFPAWVDSVHHALLTRLIAESGQVPTTYVPYVPSTHATYHYGFQAHTALFMRLSGLALPQAMLWVGQYFNAGMALQVYLLARWLTKRRWTALFAALSVAILGTMPAFYVTWGRYTQLTGLLILPVALILSVESIRHNALQGILLTILTLAGLIVTHYRVFAFYVSLVSAWWLVNVLASLWRWPLKLPARMHLKALLSYAGMNLAALLLLMPWILGIAHQLWFPAASKWSQYETSVYWDFSWRYVSGGLDPYLLTLGALGLLIGLLKRERFAGVLGVWVGILFVITNPSRFGLPGEGLINNVAMLITWFIPMALGSGFLLDTLLYHWKAVLPSSLWTWGIGILSIGLVLLSGVGIRQQITMVEPQNLFAIQADYEALAWIQANTSPGSHVYINAQPWQSHVYIGSDGGYWIAPVAGRTTVIPPALYTLSSLESLDEVRRITTLAQRGEATAADPALLLDVLHEAGADYLYIGALGGSLDPDVLHEAPMFDLQYENERVTIFAIAPVTSTTN